MDDGEGSHELSPQVTISRALAWTGRRSADAGTIDAEGTLSFGLALPRRILKEPKPKS